MYFLVSKIAFVIFFVKETFFKSQFVERLLHRVSPLSGLFSLPDFQMQMQTPPTKNNPPKTGKSQQKFD
jgi:hypothetical protein